MSALILSPFLIKKKGQKKQTSPQSLDSTGFLPIDPMPCAIPRRDDMGQKGRDDMLRGACWNVKKYPFYFKK